MSRRSRNPVQLAARLHRTATGIRRLSETAHDDSLKERVSAWANTCDEAAARLEEQTRGIATSTPESVGQDAARARQFADRLAKLVKEER
jgi:hypothetical protein